MAEEEKKDTQKPTPTGAPLTDQDTGDKVKPTPEYTPGDSERLAASTPEETGFEAAVEAAIDSSEKAVDAPAVEGFSKAVDKIEAAFESLQPPTTPEEALAEDPHLYSDVVHLPGGASLTLPGGIYTFVFAVLGVITLTEIILAEILPDDGVLGGLRTIILVVASLCKALLVVYYYMHLNTDNRIFRWVLGLPVFIGLLSAIYLLAVPPTGY